ncbi:chymotrypsin inhibitor-like [Ceratina calcarata]|uniref:Chymotrypsin inhibitor-like n=1 Tax=Ceratina calcarata TaxID=156304 RepID=A0AAJ7JCH8_9HYME|nr:chymotrypsin inhibitor-like [Ceratina calcarata]
MSRVTIILALLAAVCVYMDSVKAQDCGPNQLYRDCSSMCEPTCKNPDPICIEECGPPKCQCKENYVKHHGVCIPLSDC